MWRVHRLYSEFVTSQVLLLGDAGGVREKTLTMDSPGSTLFNTGLCSKCEHACMDA